MEAKFNNDPRKFIIKQGTCTTIFSPLALIETEIIPSPSPPTDKGAAKGPTVNS